jgi:hypothetical protein
VGSWEGALVAASSSPPSSMAWVGAGVAGIGRGETREHGYSTRARSNSAAPVILISLDFLLPPFDEMSTRTQNSNFSNLTLWVLIILDKVPCHIFVLEKQGVLQKFIFQIGYGFCFRFKLWLKFEWCSDLKFL